MTWRVANILILCQNIFSAAVVTQYLEVTLANGNVTQIPVSKTRKLVRVDDRVHKYGTLVLELGMVFEYLLLICHTPDRARLLAVVKMMVKIMKANNTNAKYPLDLLRLLVQQYSLLSQQEAHLSLQSCFVNLKGKENSHRPADHVMEGIIKEQKAMLKHMGSNRSAETIEKRSAAIPGIKKIAENYNNVTEVLKVRESKWSIVHHYIFFVT